MDKIVGLLLAIAAVPAVAGGNAAQKDLGQVTRDPRAWDGTAGHGSVEAVSASDSTELTAAPAKYEIVAQSKEAANSVPVPGKQRRNLLAADEIWTSLLAASVWSLVGYGVVTFGAAPVVGVLVAVGGIYWSLLGPGRKVLERNAWKAGESLGERSERMRRD
jgi:hypothetical protein